MWALRYRGGAALVIMLLALAVIAGMLGCGGRRRPPKPARASAKSGTTRRAGDPSKPPYPPAGASVTHTIAPAPALPGNLGARQLAADSDPNNWTLYGRNYQAWRYSPLTQITPQNVKSLKVAWQMDTGMHQGFEATPIVVDGTMYFSTPWNHVIACDATNGKIYWRYAYKMKGHPVLCCDAVNRGVGVGNGKVVMGTLDAYIVALDAKTGKELWATQLADVKTGHSVTAAPQIIGNKAIVGISGGEYGIRGFIDAYDINTGKRLWRFWTIPGPGETGHETWGGDSWKNGGAPQWMTCTYDPAMKTIFAGVGNPGPDLDGTRRPGDNLYSDSIVALDVNTGQLKWYYQTVPHDTWDLDTTVCPVIDDLTIDGKLRKVVMFAPKNGYFYVLDRTNGKPIYALKVADKVTWGKVTPDGVPHPDRSKTPVEGKTTVVAPGASGGKEWVNESYNPKLKRMFIPLIEEPFAHELIKQPYTPGEFYWGGNSVITPSYGHIVAVDVPGKKIAWNYHTSLPMICPITNTASGLVITGTPEQTLLVLDARTGKLLWSYEGLSGWHGGPMSYAVRGKQYIAFPNGWGGPVNRMPKIPDLPIYNTLYVFSLP